MFSKPISFSTRLRTAAKKETQEDSQLQRCFNWDEQNAGQHGYPSKCEVHQEEQIIEGLLLNSNFHLLDTVSWCSSYSNLEYKISLIKAMHKCNFQLSQWEFLLEEELQDLVHRISQQLFILVGSLIVSVMANKGEISWDRGFVRKFLCLHKKLSQLFFNVFSSCNTCVVIIKNNVAF